MPSVPETDSINPEYRICLSVILVNPFHWFLLRIIWIALFTGKLKYRVDRLVVRKKQFYMHFYFWRPSVRYALPVVWTGGNICSSLILAPSRIWFHCVAPLQAFFNDALHSAISSLFLEIYIVPLFSLLSHFHWELSGLQINNHRVRTIGWKWYSGMNKKFALTEVDNGTFVCLFKRNLWIWTDLLY